LEKLTAIQVRKTIETLGFLAGAFAVCTQFALTLSRVEIKGLTYTSEILRYWGYMTIWTNTLVTLIWAAAAFNIQKGWMVHLRLHSMRTAAAMYILFVGVVYHWLLSTYMQFSTRLDWFNDFILHTIVPIFYVIYWLFLLPKTIIRPSAALQFMIYPLVYGVYTFIRGEMTGQYPYPFFDVLKIGYGSALLNGLGFMLFYGFIGSMLIALNNRWADREKQLSLQEG
jgi:hypothetical protein